MLVEAYPIGARVQDRYGNLPLHRASQNRATAESIRVLLAAYPNSAAVQNKYGQSPLHKASEICAGENESLQILHLLLESCPGSINMIDEDNIRPSE
jgi:ankyrin repeat protein